MKFLNLKKETPDPNINYEKLFERPLIDRILRLLPWGNYLCNWAYDTKLALVSKYQKIRYGVSDLECWNLPETFADYILPRLLHFKKMKRYSHPSDLTEEKWEQIIDELIWTFDYIKDAEKYNPNPFRNNTRMIDALISGQTWESSDNERVLIDKYFETSKRLDNRKSEGLQLFAKWYDNLWD